MSNPEISSQEHPEVQDALDHCLEQMKQAWLAFIACSSQCDCVKATRKDGVETYAIGDKKKDFDHPNHQYLKVEGRFRDEGLEFKNLLEEIKKLIIKNINQQKKPFSYMEINLDTDHTVWKNLGRITVSPSDNLEDAISGFKIPEVIQKIINLRTAIRNLVQKITNATSDQQFKNDPQEMLAGMKEAQQRYAQEYLDLKAA